MASEIPFADPTALAKYGRIDVVARQIVEGYMVGQHKSPFKGSSVEFVEHRQYYPGDEIRHIDWRAFGKTGRYYIKEFEEETNFRAYLFVDASGSMAYEASTISKFRYACYLAAALGCLLTRQRDAVGLFTIHQSVRDRIEPSTNPKNFQQITNALENCTPAHETRLGDLVSEVAPMLKRRSLVVIISDFFDDLEKVRHAFQLLKRQQQEVLLFQIIAPEEDDFPFTKPTQFRDLEFDSRRILADPHRLRAIYLEQFGAHQQELKAIAARAGFDFVRIVTNEPYDKALGAFLSTRTRRTK